jgi:hypothetical protein
MVACKTSDFATYNTCKKQVIHVIPSIVWRNVYFELPKKLSKFNNCVGDIEGPFAWHLEGIENWKL